VQLTILEQGGPNFNDRIVSKGVSTVAGARQIVGPQVPLLRPHVQRMNKVYAVAPSDSLDLPAEQAHISIRACTC